jgi:hypothetical protein
MPLRKRSQLLWACHLARMSPNSLRLRLGKLGRKPPGAGSLMTPFSSHDGLSPSLRLGSGLLRCEAT